jgi:hypothetical protein
LHVETSILTHHRAGALRLLLEGEVEPDHMEMWKNLCECSWDKGEHDFLMDHGFFVGNDEVNAKQDPGVHIDESFQDAKEEEDGVDTDHDNPSYGGPSEIELPPCFPNLISGHVELPEFMNHAVDFTETLDYILASPNLLRKKAQDLRLWQRPPAWARRNVLQCRINSCQVTT